MAGVSGWKRNAYPVAVALATKINYGKKSAKPLALTVTLTDKDGNRLQVQLTLDEIRKLADVATEVLDKLES